MSTLTSKSCCHSGRGGREMENSSDTQQAQATGKSSMTTNIYSHVVKMARAHTRMK